MTANMINLSKMDRTLLSKTTSEIVSKSKTNTNSFGQLLAKKCDLIMKNKDTADIHKKMDDILMVFMLRVDDTEFKNTYLTVKIL